MHRAALIAAVNQRISSSRPENDIYRNSGPPIATEPNTDTYTDSTGDTGRAQYTYKVCEAGTQTCSNVERVRFRQ